MDGLRQQGKKIPEDYALIGVDDIPMSAWPSYNLTTIRQPLDDITKQAVDDLMLRIEDERDANGDYLLVQGEVVQRGSA